MIIADDRELRNKKEEYGRELIFNTLKEKGLNIIKQRLEIGDYLLDGGYVIERKSDDLVSSITSKRIFEQLNNLCDYPHPILVITIKNLWKTFYYTQSRWIDKAYLGFLTTLTVSYPMVKVIFLEDTEEFIKYIISLDKKIHDEGEKERPKILMKKPLCLSDSQENVVASIEGVGIKTAKIILEHKKNIKNIANSTKEELMEIPSIGEKTANEIIKTLCDSYERKQH